MISETKKVWITAKGNPVEIEHMETRHLFFAVRMLWNHAVPDEFKLLPYRKYHPRSIGEKRYAVLRDLLLELKERTDLTQPMKQDLSFMVETSLKLEAIGCLT